MSDTVRPQLAVPPTSSSTGTNNVQAVLAKARLGDADALIQAAPWMVGGLCNAPRHVVAEALLTIAKRSVPGTKLALAIWLLMRGGHCNQSVATLIDDAKAEGDRKAVELVATEAYQLAASHFGAQSKRGRAEEEPDVALRSAIERALLNDRHVVGETVCAAPRIWRAPAAIPLLACEYLKLSRKSALTPATVASPSRRNVVDPSRKALQSGVSLWDQNLVEIESSATAARSAGASILHAEKLIISKYNIGGIFAAHFDNPIEHCSLSDDDIKYGPRVSSTITYLNDEFVGGETAFISPRIKISPQAGSMVMFFNILPNGDHDSKSMHASLPVKYGEKWVALQWFRESPMNEAADW